MEKNLSVGAFTELDDREVLIEGGYSIPIYGPVSININYPNRADENAAMGWIIAGAVGGAIAGSGGGLHGAGLGAAGGAVTGIIGTAVSDVTYGKAYVSVSIYGLGIRL